MNGPLAGLKFYKYAGYGETYQQQQIEAIDKVTQPGMQVVSADAIIAGSATDFSPFYGGSPFPHHSNHLNKGTEPVGGNYTFLDGHTEWRNFSTDAQSSEIRLRAVVDGNVRHWF